MINYNLILLKKKLENIFIFPFILLGKLITPLSKGKKYDVIFFIPTFHTGGAERIHLQIVQAISSKSCLIVFTKKSKNEQFYSDFKKTNQDIIDISKNVDNKLFYWNNLIWRGVLSNLINKLKSNHPIVFNCQSNFGYKISPWIKKEIKQIDIIHAFSSFSKIRIPFIEYYYKTIMISHKSIEEHKIQYSKLKIPLKESSKIIYINNGTKINVFKIRKSTSDNFRILYVGRNSTEKRIEILVKTAEQAARLNLPISFTFVCDFKNMDSIPKTSNSIILGEIHDDEKLVSIYAENDILILSSSNEGFPLVVMEAMAAGCAIISTPVGDIPYHIKNDVNGYITKNIYNENLLINEYIDIFKKITKEKLNLISLNNIEYAQHHFNIDTFNQKYIELVNNCMNEN